MFVEGEFIIFISIKSMSGAIISDIVNVFYILIIVSFK